ncbi:thermonuclease family protein [Salinicoccus roseus]|uniref:Thermonuclease family protein n=2 Tax=Salinicoccus roseus TaxID=45670 RepID=A0ABT4YKH5_9STAP|nr:thermonuclease family protein [Salinicoccus roseus]MDB0581028.1 thermonuclease family protein [Salinicoccus roseus]
MDLLFLVLSFLAALAAVVVFGVGLFKYVGQGEHRKAWQMSLMMITAASVLALMATLMDAGLSLGTGFMMMGIYLLLAAVGILLVYIVKRARNDDVQGYVRYAAIMMLAALAVMILPLFMMDDAESPVREINETFGSEEAGERIPVEVASFVDGDTTKFHFEGETASFRYLLIDTPETNHPRIGEQPLGKEASARTKELLEEAEEIEVEFDVGPRQDHYERYLAYVYADGDMVNEILVREGLAQVKYVNPPSTTHLDQLEEAEQEAEAEGLGIWSLERPYDSEGEESETGSGAFRNCTELREVHPDGVAEGHPAYTLQMDGDRDGMACE